MQNSRTFLVACAAAYCLALLPLCAADADADLKLREALEKKLNELQTQSGQAVPPPVVVAPPPVKTIPPVTMPAPAARPTPPAQWTPPPAARPLPPVTQPARVPAPIPVPAPEPAVQTTPKPVLVAPPPVDSETIAKAREALRQKMSELEGPVATAAQPAPPVTPPTPAPTPVPAPTPAPPAQPPPVAVQPAPIPTPIVQPAPKPVLVAPTPVSPETLAKAQAAMEQKMKELDAQPPVAPAQPPPMKPKTLKGPQAFPPLQGPPPAVAGDKAKRLQELLRKYRADQVTPEEYHQQRAKILAEP